MQADREQRLAGILAEDRAERFDLGCPPLLRFALIRLSADEHRLVLTNHHLLMDGWSMPVLVRELLTLYAQHGDAARAAAGDAVSGLSGVDRRAGSRCRDRGLARRIGRARRGHADGAAAIAPARRWRPSRSRIC